MNHDEFVKKYYEIAGRALAFSKKARREGLLAFEEDADEEKINNRDIFQYGLRFVIDGIEQPIIDGILSNIINQEKDETVKILKEIQKQAILAIQRGDHSRIIYAVLNSYTDIPLDEDEIRKSVED